MSKQSTVTATFRQNLRGQLGSLECAPHWACAMIYARHIHPLIMEADPETPHLGKLIADLNHCDPGNCGLIIAQWLESYPEESC